jgi:hypothetical protein
MHLPPACGGGLIHPGHEYDPDQKPGGSGFVYGIEQVFGLELPFDLANAPIESVGRYAEKAGDFWTGLANGKPDENLSFTHGEGRGWRGRLGWPCLPNVFHLRYSFLNPLPIAPLGAKVQTRSLI